MPLHNTVPKLAIALVLLNSSIPSVSKVVIIASDTASNEVSGVPCGLLKKSV